MRARVRRSLFGLNTRAVDRFFHDQSLLQQQQVGLLQMILDGERQQSVTMQGRIRQTEERLAMQRTRQERAAELHGATKWLTGGLRPALDSILQDLDRLVVEAAPLAEQGEALSHELQVTSRLLGTALEQTERMSAVAADAINTVATNAVPANAGATATVAGSRILPFRVTARDAAARPTSEPEILVARQDATAYWRPGSVGDGRGAAAAATSTVSTFELSREAVAAARAADELLPEQPADAAVASVPVQPAELRGQIAASVLRLLNGKVVGRNLVSPGGHTIAAEGTAITAELAMSAEQAGLLPELVLHMAWPPVAEV